jgi:transposase
MNISVLGIDLAKNVFQLHGVDDQEKVVVRKRLTRPQLLPFVAQWTKRLTQSSPPRSHVNTWRRLRA